VVSGPVLSTAGKINALAKRLRECSQIVCSCNGHWRERNRLASSLRSRSRRAVALTKADDLRDV
jgi:hypothetical protein